MFVLDVPPDALDVSDTLQWVIGRHAETSGSA